MERVTDFKSWLDNQGLEGAEDMLQVYRPVSASETGWAYSIIPEGVGYVVKGGEEELFLTERSRMAFTKYMDSLYELGVEGQYMFDHAMSKDD